MWLRMKRLSSEDMHVAVGDSVRLTQQIPHGRGCWTTVVEGRVLDLSKDKTEAWYAHSRSGKLWLDRIVILQGDGDVIDCILDQYSVVKGIASYSA